METHLFSLKSRLELMLKWNIENGEFGDMVERSMLQDMIREVSGLMDLSASISDALTAK